MFQSCEQWHHLNLKLSLTWFHTWRTFVSPSHKHAKQWCGLVYSCGYTLNMNCDMINVFLYPFIINQDNVVFSKVFKEICAMTCEGSNLKNPLSTHRVRISKAWGTWNGKSSLPLPTPAVFCCASQRKLSCIHSDISRACLSSGCERTQSDGLLGNLSSNYCAWFTKKKDSWIAQHLAVMQATPKQTNHANIFGFWKKPGSFPSSSIHIAIFTF